MLDEPPRLFAVPPHRLPVLAMAWATLVLAATALPTAWLAAASLRPAQGLQPWWTAWTAHFVHWSGSHGAIDAASLLLTLAIAERRLPRTWIVGALAVALPVLSLGIAWCEPTLAAYRGASGLVVLVAVCDWLLLRPSSRARGRWALWLLVGLAGGAKLAWEIAEGLAGRPAGGLGLPPGVVLAWSAHAVGAALGAGLGATLGLIARARPRA